jgi:hypothetical protein
MKESNPLLEKIIAVINESDKKPAKKDTTEKVQD